MAFLEFKAFLLPTLEWYADGNEHKLGDLDAPLSDAFGLSEEERSEMLESGTQTRLHNRVAWAHVYLAKAKPLGRIARSRYRITDRGQQLLASKPAEITPAFLRDTYPEFEEFATPTKPAGEAELGTGVGDDSTATPEERLESSYRTLRSQLAQQILDQVKACSPASDRSLPPEARPP